MNDHPAIWVLFKFWLQQACSAERIPTCFQIRVSIYSETAVWGISISSSSSNVQQTRWVCSITCQRTTKSLWTSLCENQILRIIWQVLFLFLLFLLLSSMAGRKWAIRRILCLPVFNKKRCGRGCHCVNPFLHHCLKDAFSSPTPAIKGAETNFLYNFCGQA